MRIACACAQTYIIGIQARAMHPRRAPGPLLFFGRPLCPSRTGPTHPPRPPRSSAARRTAAVAPNHAVIPGHPIFGCHLASGRLFSLAGFMLRVHSGCVITIQLKISRESKSRVNEAPRPRKRGRRWLPRRWPRFPTASVVTDPRRYTLCFITFTTPWQSGYMVAGALFIQAGSRQAPVQT